MLAPEEVALVERLLAEKRLTHHEIMEEVGVSQTTVTRIADGNYRPDRRRYQRDWEGITPPTEPKQYCDQCRAMVAQPCLRCQLVAAGRTQSAREEAGA